MSITYTYYIKNPALATVENAELCLFRLNNDFETGAPTSVSVASPPNFTVTYPSARTQRQLYVIKRIFNSIFEQDLDVENDYEFINNQDGGRNIYNTTLTPTGTSDKHSLFNAGSIVFNSQASGPIYFCVDNTPNNAKWKKINSQNIAYFNSYYKETGVITITNVIPGTLIPFTTIGQQYSDYGSWTLGVDNSTITVPQSGIYKISYSVLVTSTVNGRGGSSAIFINNVISQGIGSTTILRNGDVGQLTSSGYKNLNAGDTINVRVQSNGASGLTIANNPVYTADNVKTFIDIQLIR